jgi:hypothetical protein
MKIRRKLFPIHFERALTDFNIIQNVMNYNSHLLMGQLKSV